MWIDNDAGGWTWDGEVPPEGYPPKPFGPPPSAGQQRTLSTRPSRAGATATDEDELSSLYATPTSSKLPPLASASFQAPTVEPKPVAAPQFGTATAPRIASIPDTGAARLGTARQAQAAPPATEPVSALTEEEEAILAAGSAKNLGKGIVAYDNPLLLQRQKDRGSYDPEDWNLPARLVEKKAGLAEGSVTWDQDSQSFVIPGGANGANITIASATGDINQEGLQTAEALGIKKTPSAVDTAAPEAEADKGEGLGLVEQNTETRQSAVDAYFDEVRGGAERDTTDADENRRFQQQVFQQQQDIINRILDFDEEAFAQMFADQSLTALGAAARSTRGGQGAINAAQFGAQAQAPALFAEGSRQASSLTNERLGLASNVASSMGDLITNARQQDETRAESDVQADLAKLNQIGDTLGVDLQLDESSVESTLQFIDGFARIYQAYAGMDLQKQLAQWDNLMEKYATDAQTNVAMQKIRADLEAGKIGWDDVGLSLLSTGGQVAAARAGKK